LKHQATFLLFALLGAGIAQAQSSLDVHLGVSGVHDSSTGQSVDTFGDGNFYNTSALNGPFMNFGAGVMASQRFGFGGEFSFKPTKTDYAGLQYRPFFYDFNAIVHPMTSSKKIVPEVQAGLGGVNMKFYYSQQNCTIVGCQNSSTFVQSANHFQLHVGAGVSFFLTSNVYVRPQFDLHWVDNFTDQFKSNWVPQYGIMVGYRFGD
jgi:opacity protein-like surface antigen